MKLEHLNHFLAYFFSWKLYFYFVFLLKMLNFFFLNYFFFWKLENYSDTYWFIFSNKKSIYELKFV